MTCGAIKSGGWNQSWVPTCQLEPGHEGWHYSQPLPEKPEYCAFWEDGEYWSIQGTAQMP